MKKLSVVLIVLTCLVFTLTWMGCSNSSSQTSKETTMPTSAVSSKTTALGGESSTAATSSSPTDATSALPTSQGTLSTTTTAATTAATTTKTFTMTELQQYDGQNGNPAYVAVNGNVYDVTNVKQWDKAVHQGHVAGTDLSSVMKDSPHGSAVLNGLTVVGTFSG